MELRILKEALEHYVLSADCAAEDRRKVFDAIAECNEQAERYDSRELFLDSVYLVTTDSLSDLLNLATYDEYGKLAKAHNGSVPFDCYTHAVRKWMLNDMTNRSLQLGYEIIRDLWRDNEADGCHNDDGTMDRGFSKK